MNNRFNVFKEKLSASENVTLDFVGSSIVWGLNHCTEEETIVSFFAKFFAENFVGYNVVRYDGIVENELLPVKRFDGPNSVAYRKAGAPTAAIIKNGVGGNTVRRAINRKEDFIGKMPDGRFADLTFFMFGINDALFTDKDKFVNPCVFEKNYNELMDIMMKNTDSATVIMSTTFNGDFPLAEYRNIAEKIAKERDIPFIDTYSLWQNHFIAGTERFGQREWLAEEPSYDSCHPTPKGSFETAKFIFEKFRDLTEKR